MTRRTSYLARCALVLLLFVGVGERSISMAQESGVFVLTGDMTTERTGHTATLLADGRVLIAGGVDASWDKLQTAELYDPIDGTFTRTGEMTMPRYGHTASRLDNGMVLIAGGVDSGHIPLATAELYDPSTGTFVPTGNMVTAQMGHAATLLSNGRVLIVGGLAGNLPSVRGAAAELYDPSTGFFVPAGSYANTSTLYPGAGGAIWPTVNRLADGRVLIAGNNSAEFYDPGIDTFQLTGAMASPEYRYGMYWHSATLLLSGKVLIAGGTDELVDLDNAELYDPSTGAFAIIAGMTVRRSSHTSTLMSDGSVLITGGETWLVEGNGGRFGGSLASAEQYDPSTATFSIAASMARSRSGHRATILQNGNVLITGGTEYFAFVHGAIPRRPTSMGSAELYIPAAAIAAPRLLSVLHDGQERAAILHAGTDQFVSLTNSATAGQVLEIYCTGLGDGSSVIPPEVTIGGVRAEVLFFGKASRFAGLNQLNVRVPSGIVAGPAVPVRLTYLERPSNETTIPVR